MSNAHDSEVLVRVQPISGSGRQIRRPQDVVEDLKSRQNDIARGVAAGTAAIVASVPGISEPQGWSLDSVEAKFGVTLGVEGSIVVSKASLDASFEITVHYRRNAQSASDST